MEKATGIQQIGGEMEDFEIFWKEYPRKIAKADARKAWNQTSKIRPSLDQVLNSLKAACKTEQWMRSGGQFIPYAATWLRGERWEDTFEVVIPDVVNEKPWYESASGIEAKGRELGINPFDYQTFPEFKAAVMRATMKAA